MEENIMSEKYVATFPVCGLLGIAFVVLKLCGVIAWSWWWVLAPFWFPTAAVLAILFGILLVTSIVALVVNPWKK